MLNLLVNLQKRLVSRGGELTLHPNMEITRLLDITGLGGLFEIVEDTADVTSAALPAAGEVV